MVAPSANLSGKPSPTLAEHVRQDFPTIEVVDGGPCQCGLESTIISLVGKPTILRPGSITKEQLEEALGEKVFLSHSKEALAPGMKYRHYAPKAPLFLFENEEELWNWLNLYPQKKRIVRFGISANDLYKFLRECDLEKLEEILIFLDGPTLADSALMNRLRKASLC